MIVFATSDQGGTGRSVTCANIAYRLALGGDDVAYVDFDFGSPTAAAVFASGAAARGVRAGGLHSFLQGRIAEPTRLDVWSLSQRAALREGHVHRGRLCLVPGDRGGGDFPVGGTETKRCAELLLTLEEEFDVTIVDLRAGRSYALDVSLRATARQELRHVPTRWLVFHRWTRQHVEGAVDLVHGDCGILRTGVQYGHDETGFSGRLRYVPTAVPPLDAAKSGSRDSEYGAWRKARDAELKAMTAPLHPDHEVLIGPVPLDPVLLWQERVITDEDTAVSPGAAEETVRAFTNLAHALKDSRTWAFG
ncbi:SCO2523 family variant P-loop protein [Streptomyces sp. NPDC029041]|uniref:SCO2523 family variant P-loop protein n=1 Tax=Streptomyces sp. NPDC029041 TaxID=3155727 RepID=UPI003402C006